MEFGTLPKTIKGLLTTGKRYFVPKYQRQFSWTKAGELRDFLNDVRGRLRVMSDGALAPDDYFFGTIILQGLFDSGKKEDQNIYVIDGQQRFTAITILLRVLSDKLNSVGEKVLADAVWKYVMERDDDGDDFAVFTNESPCPFFQFKIQRIGLSVLPSTEEEDLILSAYEFFTRELSEKALLRYFTAVYPGISVTYTDCLKLIRDQLLGSTVIVIWTPNGDCANSIFEIMNAKGLELTPLDLIKNSVFSLFGHSQESLILVQNSWKNLENTLNGNGARIPPMIFFVHFWSAKYGKKEKKGLYRDFAKKIKTKNDCEVLLAEMNSYAKIYYKITKPDISQFHWKKQYLPIVQMINELSNVFSLEMPRPFLMVLDDKKTHNVIKMKDYLQVLRFLVYFHFVYSCVCSLRTNKIEGAYIAATSKLFSENDRIKCLLAIKEFEETIFKALPPFQQFFNSLSQRAFSNKTKLPNSEACGFFLREQQRLASKQQYFDDQAFSIEHVFGDDPNQPWTQNIKYLLPLESFVNNRISGNVIGLGKIKYYKASSYEIVSCFVEKAKDCQNDSELKSAMGAMFESETREFYASIVRMKIIL